MKHILVSTFAVISFAALIGLGVMGLALYSCGVTIQIGSMMSDVKVCHANTFAQRGDRCLAAHPQFAQNPSITNTPRQQKQACLKAHPSWIRAEELKN